MKTRFTRIFYFKLVLCAALLLSASGCMDNAYLRGLVLDISGEELPGVVVRVVDTEYEGLSNANGLYAFRSAPGILEIEFSKTGYAPARKRVVVPSLGILDIDAVLLWPIPIGEGVYTFENSRYFQTDHPRVNRYNVQDAGFAYGTPVEPGLRIAWSDPDMNPDANPPTLIAHKMPAYDARMHQLRQVKAAAAHTGTLARGDRSRRDIQYTEEIFIAGEPIPLLSRPIDEPERLLLELRAARPLAPGLYAIHWGALEGYDGIDPRVFLFEVREEHPDEEGEVEGEGEKSESEG